MRWESEEIREIRERMRMSRQEFAQLLGVDVRSVYRWEGGETAPSGQAESILLGIRQALDRDRDRASEALAAIGALAALGGIGLLIGKLIELLSGGRE